MKFLFTFFYLMLLVSHSAILADSSSNHAHMHHHSKIAVDNYKEIPTIKINVAKDTVKGWNLRLITSNFKFTPENINKKPVDGEGHAHLYVNDRKTRLYGHWFYIEELDQGKNKLRVTLNANDHSDLTLKNEVIQDFAIIEVKD